MRQTVSQLGDIHSEISDVNERVWGDVGVLTHWLDQTYTYQGTVMQISAPTTLLFRRDGDDWKMTVFHSVPLPEQG